MFTYDEIIAKAISMAIPAAAPASDPMQYYGQVGDFFGGFWGTIIGVVTLVFVFATWSSTRKIDSRSKIYQVFAEILRTHEEIVTSLRLGKLSGREAISEMLSEFYDGYAEIQKMEVEDAISIPIEKRINAAFLLMYYGAHPETATLLNSALPQLDGRKLCDSISIQKKSNNKKQIIAKLGAKLDGDPADRSLWHQSIRDSFHLVNSLAIPNEQKGLLREVLTKAQTRPHNILDKHKIADFIEEHSLTTEFGGHQNRLSHYFRNLHSAFTFIDSQRLSKKEKHSLSKVLRSKLSNYEQALLAINALSEQGSSWIKSGLIDEYMPIKNIPKHFFSFDSNFDLKQRFPQVTFEWESLASHN
jgi:hypothetical protein